MTTDLEKKFFDTFEIEPKPYCCYHDCNCPINDVGKFNSKCPKQAVTKECDARIIQKPQIIDHILLELLCLINQVDMYYYDEEDFYTSFNYENFKQEILSKCKRLADKNAFSEVTGENFKRQVQELFKDRE